MERLDRSLNLSEANVARIKASYKPLVTNQVKEPITVIPSLSAQVDLEESQVPARGVHFHSKPGVTASAAIGASHGA